MRSLVPLVLAVAAVLACERQLTPTQRNVQEQVLRDRVEGWARHLNNQAVDSLAAYYESGATLVSVWPDGSRAMGWEERERELRQLMATVSTLNLVLQDPRIRITDRHTAVVTFRYSMDQILAIAQRDVFSGHGTQVWVRDGTGPWHIAVSHLSRTPVGQMAQPIRRR